MSSSSPSDRPVGTRGFEVAVAVLLQVIAVMVIVDSIRVGNGWADDGPKAGYFPFYIGLLLFAAATWVLINALRGGKSDPPFATREELTRVVSMFIPMLVYVAGIALLGIYVASALLIAFFMIRHGRYRWPLTAAVSLGVPVLLFLVFERWFLVPLPKGPLEALFGY
jgi:putative tricarboxylic transport membrane protein